MRMHIEVDDQLVATVDKVVGARRRSQFVRTAIARALAEEMRWTRLEAAAGAIPAVGHEWDEDPASWVRQQRHGDARRGG